MYESHRNAEYEAAHQPQTRWWRVLFALLLVGWSCMGCAAIKPFASILIEHGIAKAEELAKGGRAAIDDARAKAEAIPDQLDRIEALAEVTRAEQMYQTGILEELAGALLQPKEWDSPPPVEPQPSPEPTAAKSAVLAGAL